MNPVREALYAALTGDATLTGMLSAPDAIHHRVAPPTAAPPFVVFHKQSGTDAYTFGGDAPSPQTWLVKAVDRALSSSRAEDIEARIRAVLNAATLPLSGGLVLDVRRVAQIDYGEPDGAETWQHVGGLYRLVTDGA